MVKDGVIVQLSQNIKEYEEKLALSQREIDNYKDKLAFAGRQVDNYNEEVINLTNRLSESYERILKLEKELSSFYLSAGYRFILIPFFKITKYSRLVTDFLIKGFYAVFSAVIFVIIFPLILLQFLFFIIEWIAGVLFAGFFARRIKIREVVPFDKLKTSVVIPNWNGIDMLRKCLSSIYEMNDFQNDIDEILVVDDSSSEDIAQNIKNEFPEVKVIRNLKNQGFGRSCNRGIREAKGDLIVLLNNDIMVSKDFFKPLKRHFEDRDLFSISPKLYCWDEKTFNFGMHMGKFKDGYLSLWNEAETGNGDKVSRSSPSIFAVGGAMVFRKSDFFWLGGFDDIYRPNCWEDIDISYRAQKRGLKVLYEPRSLAYHKGAATLNYVRHKEIKNELLFMWKNINDKSMLLSHFMHLPKFFYQGKHSSREVFLRGYLWAFNYLLPALIHRLKERRYISCSDKEILNRSMLYYRNFMRNEYNHSKKKTILLVTPFIIYPLNSGGKLRIYNIYKRLSGKYNLILLSLIHHEEEAGYSAFLSDIFNQIHTIHTKTPSNEFLFPTRYKYSFSRLLIDKLKDIQDKSAVDIVHIESNELLYLAKYVKYAPLVYTEHDISIISYRASYYNKGLYDALFGFMDYLKLVYYHHKAYRQIDHVVTLSEEDKRVINAFSPRAKARLIPTGVDLEHFSFSEKSKNKKSLIFVGHYPHYPNEEAVVYFSRKIFPLIKKVIPEVTLQLVGSSPTQEVIRLSEIEGVELVGSVTDVNPYLQGASVFVTAFRRGSGIRGKVLEAMATGTPVVCTPRGAYGIAALNGKEILIADSPEDFARQVIELLHNGELYKNIASDARKLVEEKYDWNKLAVQLDILYQQIIADINIDGIDGILKIDPVGDDNAVLEEKKTVSNIEDKDLVHAASSCKDTNETGVIKDDKNEKNNSHIPTLEVKASQFPPRNKISIIDIREKVDKIIGLSLDRLSEDNDFSVDSKPEELHIELTHLCNSRCITCDIWDSRERNNKTTADELSLEEIKDLLVNSKYLDQVKIVVLSGGEPFLRKDIVDICNIINQFLPRASLGILTNGMDRENIISKTREILKTIKADLFWIGSSLDGIGEVYDKIRGVPGGFERFKKTVESFKAEFPEVKFSTTFVLTPFNTGHLVSCWDFADSYGLDFFAQFGVVKAFRPAEVFTWQKEDFLKIEEYTLEIIEKLVTRNSDFGSFYGSLITVSDKINLLTKIYYWSNLVSYQLKKERIFKKCDAGNKFAMFDPYGNLFYCPLLKDRSIGNIKEQKFDDLWFSPEAESIRKFIDSQKCSCWLVCTVFPIVNKALSLYGDRSAAELFAGVFPNPKKEMIAENNNLSAEVISLDDCSNSSVSRQEEKDNSQINNREFSEKKIILDSFPQGVTIGTNYKCNADCMFCLGGDYKPFSLDLYKSYFEPNLGEMLSKSDYVSFCGMGELLLIPEREDFLDYINKTLPGQNKILTTNGLVLNESVFDRVKESNYCIQISLHASNSLLHSQLTGIKGGFDIIIEQIRRFISKRKNKSSPHIVLNFLINTLNIENLPSFVELAASLGVDCVRCNYLTIFKPAHLKLSCFFKQKVTNGIFDISRLKAEELSVPLVLPAKFSGHNQKDFRVICPDPWKNIYLDTEGAVLPCCYSGEHFGELSENSIFEIWNNKKYQQLRVDLSSGNAVEMCRYCLNNNPFNVNLLNSHVSLRKEVQKEILETR